MSGLVDEKVRQRFACDLSRNFSVVASAGSGKTRAITDRVVEIARSRQALEWLPQLVVVTYTNRAADEMQQRARQQILEDVKLSKKPEVIEAFNRAFFGTIHSFCMKLLAAHGHDLGVPRNLELIADEADLWNQFVQHYTTIGRSLSWQNRRILLRHVQARQLMELARNAKVDLRAAEPERQCSDTGFAEVYAANEKPSLNIAKAKAELTRWEKRWRETDEFVAWPACATTSKQFVGIWREAFRPLRDWVNACALCVAAEVQRDYREFRLERGLVTYADQVALAGELMRLPDVARRIREKTYRVILDEAQDTDPQQFFVLLEIARPPAAAETTAGRPEASGAWLENPSSSAGPRPGHFCMVGDFQQSIYRDPADLARYRELHEVLVATNAAQELKFSVTFRLDTTQLNFVNATFGEILNNQEGQVAFVELNRRPDVLPGQVVGVLREIFGLSDDDLHRFSQAYPTRFQIREHTSGNSVVAKALNNLLRIRQAIVQQPLFSAVQEIVRCTQLRERLRSLPEEEFADLSSELDEVLSITASAEARGLSLSDLGQTLRTQFHATRETHPSQRDAIQLITAHKAKGSEWQAVIVPFLTREIHDTHPAYPYAIRNVNGPGAKIILDPTDFDECKEELKQIDRQEMERLLYVALTRAKHTLVLAFDRQFFLNSRGQSHRNSQISLLRAGDRGCNCDVVARLSNEARECTETRDRQRSAPLEHISEQFGARELGWIDDARREAARFVQTISP